MESTVFIILNKEDINQVTNLFEKMNSLEQACQIIEVNTADP